MNPYIELIPFSRQAWWRRAGLLLFALVALLSAGRAQAQLGAVESLLTKPIRRTHEMTESKAGPWGKLEYYHFYLEAPEHLASKFNLPSPITRWAFDKAKKDDIAKLLKDVGYSEETVQRLLSPRRITMEGENLFLFPSKDDIEKLTPEARSQLYRVLAKNPANDFQASPVIFLTDTVDEWAQDSGLPARVVDKLKQLSYHRGNALAFADVPFLIASATSDKEAHFIFRKLTRVRTVLACLIISDDENLSALLDYWSTGLGLRRNEIEPLLLATRETEGVSRLDLLHILPPLPRKLLYTYVDPKQAALGRFPDCHWTSLNFFNFEPQNYYLDTRLATSAVLENFQPVKPPYHYGDVLMFLDRDDHAIHSCTYLADDLVFTKNGSNIMTPWMLLQLGDLQKMYDDGEGSIRIEGFRHK